VNERTAGRGRWCWRLLGYYNIPPFLVKGVTNLFFLTPPRRGRRPKPALADPEGPPGGEGRREGHSGTGGGRGKQRPYGVPSGPPFLPKGAGGLGPSGGFVL
jgi:hypothetical protein